jgi:hypothetical protein
MPDELANCQAVKGPNQFQSAGSRFFNCQKFGQESQNPVSVFFDRFAPLQCMCTQSFAQ